MHIEEVADEKQGIFAWSSELYIDFVSLYTHAVVDGSLTCSFWLQGLDGQNSARPSRPFPVLSDGTSSVVVSSLPESVENGKNFLMHTINFVGALKRLTTIMRLSP